MRPWRARLLAVVAVSLPLSCASKRPPSLADLDAHDSPDAGQGDAGPDSDGGLDLGDASVAPTGPCGAQSIPATITQPPNISFIIDHSASMRDEFAGSGVSKYETARVALWHVLKAVGHRVSYSATVFPGLAGVTGCEAGDELLKMGPGDPPSFALAGTTGPRLRKLLDKLSIAATDGGTPAAATLSASLPSLKQLEGSTYVVLITDGAPNCNADLMCRADACIPNIEGLSYGGQACTDGFNCCQPNTQLPDANLSCVDAQASLKAVKDLADAGIKTFVVGMPGSEPYEQLLSQMAELGGTARDGDQKYYPVDDSDVLESSLKAIAASVSISCDIPLDYEPPDPDFVNVYFDGQLVEYDPEQGWEWTDDGHVAIRGASCDELSAGDVLEVQILAGCKTVVK